MSVSEPEVTVVEVPREPARPVWWRRLMRFSVRPLLMLAYLAIVGTLIVRLWDDVTTFIVFCVAMTVGLVVDRRLEGPGYIGAAIAGMLGGMFADAQFNFSLLDSLNMWSRGWTVLTVAVCGALVSFPYAFIWRRLDPQWGQVVARKAQRKLERGHADSALAQYTYAIETHPGEAIHFNNRGLAYLRLAKYAEALQDFSEALNLNPRLTAGYSNRANCFLQLGDAERALDDLAKALDCEPQNAALHYQRGVVLRRLGDTQRGYDSLTQALTLDPSLSTAYVERATILAASKKAAAAIEDLNRAVWITPDYGAAYHLRGQINAERRNFTGAIQDFTAAIRAEPNQATYYRSRAAAYEATSYFAESRADLDRAQQLAPQ